MKLIILNNLFMSLLLSPFFANASTSDCDKVEYAELKDMTTDDQTKLFCLYRTNYLFHNYFFEMRMPNMKALGQYDDLIKDQKVVNACKDEMLRVEKLLHAKNIITDNQECKCPDWYTGQGGEDLKSFRCFK